MKFLCALGALPRLHIALVITVCTATGSPAWAQNNTGIASFEVQASNRTEHVSYEASIEAEKQTVIAAQVAGAITELRVQAGQTVRTGDVLLRIDARTAQQSQAAQQAQVAASQAQLKLAQAQWQRQKLLQAQNFVSQAALDQAQAALDAAKAHLTAQQAQLQSGQTQTTWHTITAPYSGVVAEINIEQGDMAMPGRPLLTLYEPGALRASAAIPSSVLGGKMPVAHIATGAIPNQNWAATRVHVLPTVDPRSLTQVVRASLPAGTGLSPGQFVRMTLALPNQTASGASAKLWIPTQAVLRRAEMTGVYVLNPSGQPLLRQVRLGPVTGQQVEVLAGLSSGERIVHDPLKAARQQHSTKP